MEKMKKRISKWLLALMSTVLVLASLIGCSASEVNEAIDVAVEVSEVVEEIEAAAIVGEVDFEDDSSISIETIEQDAEDPEDDEILETDLASEETVQEETEAPAIDEDGHYISKEEVALYIHTYGKLPSNFITKKEAEDLGWKKKEGKAGQLHVVAPGMSIGGSKFGNYEGLLPEKKGRKYYECDINYVNGNRGAERIVYSNDGLIFYTGDHYESFEQLYPEE